MNGTSLGPGAAQVVRRTFFSLFVAGALAGLSVSLSGQSVVGAFIGASLALAYAALMAWQCFRVCAALAPGPADVFLPRQIASAGLALGVVCLLLGGAAGFGGRSWSGTPIAALGVVLGAVAGAVAIGGLFRRVYGVRSSP